MKLHVVDARGSPGFKKEKGRHPRRRDPFDLCTTPHERIASTLYRTNTSNEIPDSRERYSFRRGLEVVKAAVPLAGYARQFTDLKPSGLRLVGLCPLPGHAEKTPSFTIFSESQSFYCFGCHRRGDVLDLYMAIEDWPEDQYGPALVALAERTGVELPQRPERWHGWQFEKTKRRSVVRKALVKSYQRRYFRIFGDHLSYIADPVEYREEARRFFDDMRPLAEIAAVHRLGREHG